MKVKKFESVPAYPSYRQFAECKMLLGVAVIGLGGAAVLAADPPIAVGGDIRMEPRKEAPSKRAPKAKGRPDRPPPPPAIAGGIQVDPRIYPPAIGGVIVMDPKQQVPPPPPSK